VDVEDTPGRRLLSLAAGVEEIASKVVALGPFLASTLLSGAQGGTVGSLLSLASTSVPLRWLFLPTAGVFWYLARNIHYRARHGNPNAYCSAELLLVTSAVFYAAMAFSGPVVIALPKEWLLHPALVWPIIQDLIVAPLQLATLYWKAGSDLSSAAPVMALATVKTAAAIGAVFVSPYSNWCRLACWSSLGLMAIRLKGLQSRTWTISSIRIRMIADLFVFCEMSSLWTQTFVGLGYVSESTSLHLGAFCDLLSKAGCAHLLTKQSPDAAEIEDEPMMEPPPGAC
jgi:hypothetical protein